MRSSCASAALNWRISPTACSSRPSVLVEGQRHPIQLVVHAAHAAAAARASSRRSGAPPPPCATAGARRTRTATRTRTRGEEQRAGTRHSNRSAIPRSARHPSAPATRPPAGDTPGRPDTVLTLLEMRRRPYSVSMSNGLRLGAETPGPPRGSGAARAARNRSTRRGDARWRRRRSGSTASPRGRTPPDRCRWRRSPTDVASPSKRRYPWRPSVSCGQPLRDVGVEPPGQHARTTRR